MQVAIGVFACLQLALLLLWCLSRDTISPSISITSAALGLTSAFVLALLSHLEHKRSTRPSFLASFYILVTLVFDIARARTHWLLRQNDDAAATLTAIVASKLFMLIFEATEKRSILLSKYEGFSTESTSGLFSRAFFYWLNPYYSRDIGAFFRLMILFQLLKIYHP